MGQLLVRNLDDCIIKQLKMQALERGTSLEQMARDVLAEAASRPLRVAWFEAARVLRAMSRADPAWDSAAEVRAERDAMSERAAVDLDPSAEAPPALLDR